VLDANRERTTVAADVLAAVDRVNA
jgi:hypothetical protein